MSELSDEVQRIISRPQFTVRHTAAARCEFQSHCHPAFTVTAVLAGRLEATIGPSRVDLSAGQSAFTNINQNHAGQGDEVEFVSASVSGGLVTELLSEIGLTYPGAEIKFRTASSADPAISAAAQRIANEMKAEMLGQGAMLDALVRQLVVHLLRSHLAVRKCAQIELSRAGPVDRRLRRAIEFIHDNYSRDLTLGEIATAAYLSEYHFARLFKQITGTTPHAYLANLRLERARKLLLETTLPISEIAAMVGYQSQSHFTKIFKGVTGLTPHAYRNGSARQ